MFIVISFLFSMRIVDVYLYVKLRLYNFLILTLGFGVLSHSKI